jgi:hypothetical protein
VQSAETITSHQAMQSGATMHCTGVSSSCMRAWKSFSGFGFVKAITCSLARTCVSSSCMRAWKSFSGSGFVDHHCDSTSDVVMGTFSASRGNQRPSRAITGDQWRSREIKGDRTFSSSANRDSSSDLLTCNQAYTRVIVGPSEAIRGHQRPSPRGSWRGNQRPSPRGSWRGHQRPSEAITSRLLARQSEAIRGHHLAALGEAIRGHQRPSPRGSWRGNQRQSEAITSRLLARQRVRICSPNELPIDVCRFVNSRLSRAMGLSSTDTAPLAVRGCSATIAVCTQRASGEDQIAPTCGEGIGGGAVMSTCMLGCTQRASGGDQIAPTCGHQGPSAVIRINQR